MKTPNTPAVTDNPQRPTAILCSDGFSISREKLNILRHAIGYDDNGGDRYQNARSMDERRNHFVTSPKDKDGLLCQELVAAGWMIDHGPAVITGSDNLYQVTEEGRAVVLLHKPIPPRMTPSKRRYQQFLDADCGRPFREWLGIKRKRC